MKILFLLLTLSSFSAFTADFNCTVSSSLDGMALGEFSHRIHDGVMGETGGYLMLDIEKRSESIWAELSYSTINELEPFVWIQVYYEDGRRIKYTRIQDLNKELVIDLENRKIISVFCH